MSQMYSEGASDYIAVTPATIISLVCSGSVGAGMGVAWDGGNTSMVYVASNVNTGSAPVQCAGLALQSGSNGQSIPVLISGVVKNLTKATSAYTFTPGMWILLSGSGGAFAAAPLAHAATIVPWCCGVVVSGSGNFIAQFSTLP